MIFAAVDGLVLQPRPHPHTHQQQQAIKIDYKGNVGPLLKNQNDGDAALSSFESHGVIGMLFMKGMQELDNLLTPTRSSQSGHFSLPNIDLWSRTSRTSSW